jgi:hypothetical protein
MEFYKKFIIKEVAQLIKVSIDEHNLDRWKNISWKILLL